MQANKNAVIGFVVVGIASLLGCTPPPNMGGGPIGSVTVALETVGPDGASYRFPAGSVLSVFNTSSGAFSTGFKLDGTETVLTETLPIGNYETQMYFSGDGSPQLIRTLNGMSQTVAATWSDPQPLTFSIGENMVTPLLLHFTVARLGDVTFQTGRLQVSIDVKATSTTTPHHGQVSATFADTRQSITGGLRLETPLGLVTGETDAALLTFDLTSAFVLTSPPAEVCANITVSSMTSPSGSAPFGALMEELGGVTGAAGTVCIVDVGANDSVEIHFLRNGAAPADQQAFLPGANYRFAGDVVFSVGDILDGTTFQLSKLGAPISLGAVNGATLTQQIDDLDARQTLESCIGNLTEGTFQLTP